jgi:hypothetical protein
VYLGEAHDVLGRPAAARQAWRQALAILEDLHHPEAAQVRSLLDGLQAPRSETPRERHVAHAGSRDECASHLPSIARLVPVQYELLQLPLGNGRHCPGNRHCEYAE